MEPAVEQLRREIHVAIEDVFSRHRSAEQQEEITVQSEGGGMTDWTYRWPDGGIERYDRAEWYRVSGNSGDARVLVGHTRREAWGENRERYVVFAQLGRNTSQTFYPWTEFAATDDGSFAALIPDPRRPRASLKAGDQLPPRIADGRVERTDALYGSVKDSPSLRLVVSEGDGEAMIRHGYWVAMLRHRLRG